MDLPRSGVPVLDDVLDEVAGKSHRRDAVLPRTGGPAGNARLTSWLGLLLVPLIAVELITLADLTGLVSWHVGVGIALVAVALAKTASTSWRIGRYYTGSSTYVAAGPPPLLLRLLGPLVIVSTLAVLGSGLALIALGPDAGRQPLVTLLGFAVSPLTIHQGTFILFAVFVGLHIVARFLPAAAVATGRRRVEASRQGVPGRGARTTVVLLVLAAGLAAALAVSPGVQGWAPTFRDDVGRSSG